MTLDHAERAELKAHARAAIDAATTEFERGSISRTEWQRRIAEALSAAYLADEDPRWQSEFDGDATLWREARALVLEAAPTNGTFLDVGCANGHLIESLNTWAEERGQTLEFYGLELNPDLAEKARRRLPHLAVRIFTGNVSDWVPPLRFSCVRTGLEYVPAGEESVLLERLARRFVSPGGRVLVGPVDDRAVASTRAAFLAAGLQDPFVVSATDHQGKTRHVVWAS
jgi:trans-aconitate methyltransferase